MSLAAVESDLQIVVASEDWTLAEHAFVLWQRIRRKSGLAGRLTCSWWRFEELAVDSLRKAAAAEAAHANVIMVCAHAGLGLPKEVMDWVCDSPAADSSQPRALSRDHSFRRFE